MLEMNRLHGLFIGEGPVLKKMRAVNRLWVRRVVFDAMMAAIDLKRGEDVYIANAVKCRPPGNRTPGSGRNGCLPALSTTTDCLESS